MAAHWNTSLRLTNGGAAKLLRTNTNRYEHDYSYLLR